MNWIVAQIGAREHYAVPRALHRLGALQGLFTDAWVRPGNPLGVLKRSLGERYHHDLAGANVIAPNASLLAFEARARVKGLSGWNRIIARNQWFQKKTVQKLKSGHTSPRPSPQRGEGANFQHSTFNSQPTTLFSYSYAALELFQFAKSRGWKTVLGQIDPGAAEFRLVAEEMARFPELAGAPAPFPMEYYERNRREWELADRIIVNSRWSFDALVQQGVPPEKLVIVPLCYEVQSAEPGARSGEPATPSAKRQAPSTLRVLWLGQVNVRKGIHYLMEAAKLLDQNLVAADVRRLKLEGNHPPVQFDIVGPIGISDAAVKSAPANMTFHGRVNRDKAADWYKRSDVFVLPTLSDGFALTQLEAMTHGLPVIATPNCGEVVSDGVDGFIVPARDAVALAGAIGRYLAESGLLESQRAAALEKSGQFTLEKLAIKLEALESEMGKS